MFLYRALSISGVSDQDLPDLLSKLIVALYVYLYYIIQSGESNLPNTIFLPAKAGKRKRTYCEYFKCAMESSRKSKMVLPQ